MYLYIPGAVFRRANARVRAQKAHQPWSPITFLATRFSLVSPQLSTACTVAVGTSRADVLSLHAHPCRQNVLALVRYPERLQAECLDLHCCRGELAQAVTPSRA